MSAEIHSYEEQDCRVIKLSGRFVEVENHNDFRANIQDALRNGKKDFVIDLKGLEYLNSSGINAIVRGIAAMNESGARVVFTRVPDRITELLNVIKLNALLTIYPSIEEGLQSLN